MKLIKEQEDEWVKITPEEYLELLKYSTNNSKVIMRLPKFKNKKIWITGNLDVSGREDLKSLEGIGYVDGNLIISHSGISNISSIKVKGYVSDYGSRLDQIRKKRIKDEKMAKGQDRRESDEWNLNNEDIDEVGLAANAIFEYISGNHYDMIRQKNDGQELRKHEIELEKLLKKEKEYEAEGKDLTDIYSEIEVHQEIIDELNLKIDVYNLAPESYKWYGLDSFEFISNNPDAPNGNIYAAGTWNEVEKACRDVLQEHLEQPKYYFRESYLENYIDENAVVSYFESFYEDDVRESPESYFNESDYELSERQEKQIQSLELEIEELEHKKEKLDKDSEEYEKIQEKINELQTEIDEIVPDTDEPTEEMISDKVEEMLRDVRRNPINYIQEFGMDIENYIDKDAVIEDAISSDGPGSILNSYDGDYHTENIDGETYYIFRTE